jgi:hypothetical protein
MGEPTDAMALLDLTAASDHCSVTPSAFSHRWVTSLNGHIIPFPMTSRYNLEALSRGMRGTSWFADINWPYIIWVQSC